MRHDDGGDPDNDCQLLYGENFDNIFGEEEGV